MHLISTLCCHCPLKKYFLLKGNKVFDCKLASLASKVLLLWVCILGLCPDIFQAAKTYYHNVFIKYLMPIVVAYKGFY